MTNESEGLPGRRPWREEVSRWVTQTAASMDDLVDARWRALRRRLGTAERARVHPYLGYATGKSVRVGCRVLADPAGDRSDPEDDWWDNLLNTYRLFRSREVPGVTVQLDLGGETHSAMSDAEGYVWFDVPTRTPLDRWEGWHGAVLRISDGPADADRSAVPVGILTAPVDARFGVISDVDDTVIHTDATNLLTAARLTFLQNARTRKPLDGVAALYRSFRKGLGVKGRSEGNPIFYVSSSAWNLYPLLTDFLELNDIPAGPLFLRDIGFDEDKFLKGGHDHKLEKALRIIDAFPDLRFVLVGDSGQEDARLYSNAVQQRPGRITSVYIRDVDPDGDSLLDGRADEHLTMIRSNGVPAMRVAHSHEISTHAVGLGLIAPTAVERIRTDTILDREREAAESAFT